MEAVPAVRLANRTAEDVRAYFGQFVSRWELKDWQIGQVVDGVRILYEDLVMGSWSADFPCYGVPQPIFYLCSREDLAPSPPSTRPSVSFETKSITFAWVPPMSS